MRIRALLLLCVVVNLCAALRLAAGDAQINARGFSPTGAFAGSDVDNINTFNGNLTVSIPIQPSYPLDGGASYSIYMVFTGQPWDFVGSGKTPRLVVPNRRSNAGLGWLVGLGRMVTPSDVTNTTGAWLYASPDGSDHRFYDTLHPNDLATAGIHYTRDNTYLRLREIGTSYVELDFPNGLTHRFDAATGEILQIRTPFDTETTPSVTITDVMSPSDPSAACKDSFASSCWVIADKFGRTQYVTFTGDSNVYYQQRRVHQIILTPAHADPADMSCSSASNSLVYTLLFKDQGATTLPADAVSCYDRSSSSPNPINVPLLDHV